jgi:hypothetical protein
VSASGRIEVSALNVVSTFIAFAAWIESATAAARAESDSVLVVVSVSLQENKIADTATIENNFFIVVVLGFKVCTK